MSCSNTQHTFVHGSVRFCPACLFQMSSNHISVQQNNEHKQRWLNRVQNDCIYWGLNFPFSEYLSPEYITRECVCVCVWKYITHNPLKAADEVLEQLHCEMKLLKQ